MADDEPGSRDSDPDTDSGRDSGRPTVDDLPELRPETWPDGAIVDTDDLPPIDPDRQAVRIRDWERRDDGSLRPEVFTLPREQWARETAHHDAARQVLERLDGRFDEGYRVWTVPPDPDDPGDVGEVVVGYLVRREGGGEVEPDFPMADLNDAVPDAVDGTAARGTPFEYTVDGIPVVLERTKE